MPSSARCESSSFRLPAPASRLTIVTAGFARSSTPRMPLGLPLAVTMPLLPNGKRDHGGRLAREAARDFGEVGFPEVGPGHVGHAAPEQVQRVRAIPIRQHQLDSRGMSVPLQNRDRRVAAGYQEPIAAIVVGMKDPDSRGAGNDSVARRGSTREQAMAASRSFRGRPGKVGRAGPVHAA